MANWNLLIFGIFFLPSIIADEIKIYENGSVHWIRNWKEVEEKVNSTTTIKILEEVNTEMKYFINSPLTTTIGTLEKDTKIEGCQHREESKNKKLPFKSSII